MQPHKLEALRQLSPLQRQALSDECDIIVLTSHTKESREAAQRLKERMMSLTVNEATEQAKRVADFKKYLPSRFQK